MGLGNKVLYNIHMNKLSLEVMIFTLLSGVSRIVCRLGDVISHTWLFGHFLTKICETKLTAFELIKGNVPFKGIARFFISMADHRHTFSRKISRTFLPILLCQL